jgi:hypothetical protein
MVKIKLSNTKQLNQKPTSPMKIQKNNKKQENNQFH